MNLTDLSRTISHALRHAPWLYELELDDEGWTPVEPLLTALRREREEWADLTETDLGRMIAAMPKQRHELKDGQIRALYGHSLAGKLKKEPAEPPQYLYHGTAPDTVQLITSGGLLPMSRQYVHLSSDEATALQVGHRKAGRPVILRIDAATAHAAGVPFYLGNENVWLADSVPPEFIAPRTEQPDSR
ncbi:RNA 2'-phosphotransferase [Maioricimonas rarisocia]|nr:RNA 2'-phosphotransferase [Maioricimonas rarisocia]